MTSIRCYTIKRQDLHLQVVEEGGEDGNDEDYQENPQKKRKMMETVVIGW